MIDLFYLCEDIKNKQSYFKLRSNKIISEIFSFLSHPTDNTKNFVEGWKDSFKYTYGDISTNLSSNSKLNPQKLFDEYYIDNKLITDYVSSMQMLFFSIQTYFSLVIKYIAKKVFDELGSMREYTDYEIIMGDFALDHGIQNYCIKDWYCWPADELCNGFDAIISNIFLSIDNYESLLSIEDFRNNSNCDYIKQIYESIIPKELRHALGEYYTPDWLAERTLENAIEAYDVHKEHVVTMSIIDPTCGSGTFLIQSIQLKRKHKATLTEILSSVCGIDINPLAVLTAKTNYLFSIIDLIDGSTISIPVYITDIISLAGDTEHLTTESKEKSELKIDFSKDNYAVKRLKKADIIVGNPPWVNWEYMPEQYRKESQQIWIDYELFSAKGRELSFSKEDISVLITYIVMDKLLKEGGVIGFVIRQAVFKSSQNGIGFRKFKLANEPIKVLKVEDLSKIRAFENATNSTALFYAIKGIENKYPVPYYLWGKRKDLGKTSFGSYSQLQKVLSQITIDEQCAMPAVKDDPTSVWVTTAENNFKSVDMVLGKNNYRARTGIFTGGANAVYWLNIISVNGQNLTITNITERAKRKSEKITTEIEKTYVFPMLKGSNVSKWSICYDTYLLCPHSIDTKMWPIPQKELNDTSPNTMKYLSYFKKDLDGRNGFAGWEKEIQKQEFHAILRVGDYSFSKYKVVWKYIATEFICAVISTVKDRFLGDKLILPNEKIMYVSTNDEDEAYYLCGMLSSTPIAECVKSYMNPTSISAHVLEKLNIPNYCKNNSIHKEISKICKEGHEKKNISECIKRIDKLVAELYD